MFAIISKADGYPVSRGAGADGQELVVTWTSEAAAKGFLSRKGMESEYQVVTLTDDSLNRMALALGCSAEAIAFDAYPG